LVTLHKTQDPLNITTTKHITSFLISSMPVTCLLVRTPQNLPFLNSGALMFMIYYKVSQHYSISTILSRTFTKFFYYILPTIPIIIYISGIHPMGKRDLPANAREFVCQAQINTILYLSLSSSMLFVTSHVPSKKWPKVILEDIILSRQYYQEPLQSSFITFSQSSRL
jgi:hypothetical protein